jgi:hypothetical protein
VNEDDRQTSRRERGVESREQKAERSKDEKRKQQQQQQQTDPDRSSLIKESQLNSSKTERCTSSCKKRKKVRVRRTKEDDTIDKEGSKEGKEERQETTVKNNE